MPREAELRVGIPRKRHLTRAAVLQIRQELGPQATMAECAMFLEVSLDKIRRLFTPHERKEWAAKRQELRQATIPGRAVAQVKAMAQVFGKTPSAEQSGIPAKWMDYCYGYNRIVAMAGLVPLKRMPSAVGQRRRGVVCGLKSQRRGHTDD